MSDPSNPTTHLLLDYSTARAIGVSQFAGLSVGILAGIPLVGVLTGVGPVVYLIPLGWLLASLLLRGTTSGRLVAPPEVVLYMCAALTFLLWMATTALWAIPELSSGDDLQLLAALLAFVVICAFALDEGAVETAIYSILGGALLAAGYVFWSYASEGSLRGYGALQGQYLVVAQVVGVGTVVAVLRAVTTRGLARRLSIASALVLLCGLGLSLARGALLSAIVLSVLGVLYASWLQGSDRRSFQAWLRRATARMVLVVAVLGAIAIAIGSALSVERTRLRLIRLFSGGELSQGGRAEMWSEAWEKISMAPVFGHGLGSSGVMSGRTPDLYPHNWALQVWLDGGVIALVLCLVVLVLPLVCGFPWRRRWPRSSTSRWLPVGGAYLFLVLEYSKSSDFYTARLLLVIGVLLVYSARFPRTT